MRSLTLRLIVASLLLVLSTPAARANLATGEKGIVATVHPLASQAGINAMKNGGNAVDAAVAIALTLGVVDGHNSGIGGGCFMLIHRANGEIIALDGREMAPGKATRDMYLRGGKADTSLSTDGSLASGVPGALAVYEQAVKKYGRKPLADQLLPAAKIAEEGFPINFVYARKLKSTAEKLKKFSPAAPMFKTDGTMLMDGDLLKQPDLAKSYRAIAAQGSDWFYRGPYAKAVGEWMAKNNGIMTADDFAQYVVKVRQHFSTDYRGYQVICFPPPSSGGVHVAEILNILENFDIKGLTAPGVRQHVIAEAMKLAFADRAFWLGDPDFAKVPRGLVDKGYAKGLAQRISLDKATPVPSHGIPPDAETKLFEKHTTHFSTADAEGNWVACTATINTAFGSKVIVPGTGILLNDEMDDFSIQPGVPNAFKLIGAEANAVAARKRPLSSMSPTIVLKDGKPILSLGAAGGPTIISQTLLNLVNVLDLGMEVDQALAQPRIHQQWVPDQLRIEKALPKDVRDALKKRGHEFFEETTFGAAQIVGRSKDGKGFVGANDPRAGGNSAGW
jgi:gamma-glutamyltranspeptidase/glutathione hydrolase